MKTISGTLQTHLDTNETTLAACWIIDPTNAAALYFTNHDVDLVVGGNTYTSLSGYVPSNIKSTSTLSVDNFDMEGLLVALGITRDDVQAGVYDYADMRVFSVNYNDPDTGEIKHKKGRLGEVRTAEQFFAEFRSLTQLLQQTIGEVVSPDCRYDLGDARCIVNTSAITASSTVTSVADRANFTDTTLGGADDYYRYGLVSWQTGNNAGLEMEVKQYTSGGVFELFQPMPYAIASSDVYNAVPGCNKTLSACISKFNNVVNFGGEPHVPGLNTIGKYGGQQ